MIVILSPASVASTQVQAEYLFALNAHKKMVPVLQRDCEVPFQLGLFQRVDFRTDYPRGLKALLRALGVEPPAVASAAATGPAAASVQAEEAQPPADERPWKTTAQAGEYKRKWKRTSARAGECG